MNAAEYISKRKKDLGIDTSAPTEKATSAVDYVQKRKAELSMKPEMDAALNARGNAEMDESRLVNESRAALQTPTQPTDINDNLSAKARKIPVIGSILRGLDSFASNPIVDKGAEIARSFYIPGAGLANIAGLTNAAESGVAKAIPSLGNSLGGRVAQKAISEGIVGAPLGAAQALQIDPNSSGTELAKGAAFGAAIGGGLGAIGKFSGTKIGDAFERWKALKNPVEEQAQDVLALPPGRGEVRYNNAINRSNLSPNESPIMGTGSVRRTEPLGLPEPNIGAPTRARIEARPNEYTQKLENLFNTANKMKLTPGRELEEVESLWSQMAGPKDPSLNELIDLAYPKQVNKLTPDSLSKARTLQQSREVAGVPNRVKSLNDRYQTEINQSAAPRERYEVQKPVTEEVKYVQERAKVLREAAEPTPTQADDLIQSKEPRIRDKVYNYLDEAEKSARERLKAKRNTLSSLPLDQYADHSIILAAKLGKGGIRLADATEILVKEFGEGIRPHAKAIFNRAQNIVKETERRASKDAQEARAFNEGQTGDAESFSGKVSRDVSKEKTPFAQKLERIRTQFVDDLAPLESLEKRVRGNVASAEDSLYKSARLFRGVPEKANQIVKERLSPIIDGIEKQGYTTKQLGDYALAVHAKDVNARDIKSGFTNKEISNVIEKYGTPAMEAARKELVKVGDDMLQELVDTGVISEQLMKSLREKYPNYIPLFRAFDDKSVNFANGLSNAMANVTAPIKGLKGSERAVVDPLENMVKNIFQSTNAAERNKVAQQLSKLAKEDPESNFIRKLEDHNIAVMKDGEMVRYDVGPEVYDSLHNMDKTELDGLARKLSGDDNAKFIRQLSDKEEAGRKNVVSVIQNGNKVRYEVEPEVYKALLNLDKESSNMLIKVLQKPASLLRAGATLTPEFSLRNPLRDVAQAFVTSKSGFNPIIDFPVGLMQSISKGDLYKKWVNELGAYGNIISNDRQVHREALERVLKEPAGKKFVNILNGKTLIKMLRAISDTTESATKVGEFRAALRQGQSPQEAAYRSRDLMDFGRAGNSIREANKVVAFLNANIQGKSKLIRAFKENPAGVSARAFSAITAPTIGAFLMQKYMANDSQKLTINEAPQWMKDSFWLLPVPGTDQVARIPKPFDLNILFSNLPERAMNYIWNNDKEAMDGFAKKSIADSALPGMISGLMPFIEGMANYSFFKDSSIIPRGEEGRQYSDQYDINTTETAKLLAKGAEKLTGGKGSLKNFSSPRIMDNTIQGLTAGLGQYATSAIDVLVDKLGITDNPSRPAKGPSQQPLAKAFLVNPTQSGKSTEKLYDLKDQLTRDKGSAKFNQKPFAEDGKLGFVTEQTDTMSGITKQIRAIENDVNLTPKQKRERIDPLLKMRNEVAQQSMKRLKP